MNKLKLLLLIILCLTVISATSWSGMEVAKIQISNSNPYTYLPEIIIDTIAKGSYKEYWVYLNDATYCEWMIDSIKQSTSQDIISVKWETPGIHSLGVRVCNASNCCSDFTYHQVFIEDTQQTAEDSTVCSFPNTFTPNGDGLNESFCAHFAYRDIHRIITAFHLQIINRRGQLVFETHDPSEPWNGKFNGIALPEGTYLYKVSYYLKGYDSQFVKKGSVVLIW